MTADWNFLIYFFSIVEDIIVFPETSADIKQPLLLEFLLWENYKNLIKFKYF